MPETPDFAALGRPLIEKLSDEMDPDNARAMVVKHFRLIWNARGAADIARIDTDLSAMMGTTAAGPFVKNLDRALRTMDR